MGQPADAVGVDDGKGGIKQASPGVGCSNHCFMLRFYIRRCKCDTRRDANMEQPGQLQLAPPRGTAILLLMAGAQFMVVVDETVVNVALPSIAGDLRLDTGALSWVVNAYLLFFGGFLLVSGRLADLLGRRRLFLAGLVLFAGASAICGLAGSSGQLTGARAAQGLGAALMSPTALSILTTTFHDQAGRRRPWPCGVPCWAWAPPRASCLAGSSCSTSRGDGSSS